MKYSEKLKDPRWQKKRLEIFRRDNFECQQCGDGKSTLSVHHLRYIPGCEPWEYPATLLLTLCENCHETEFQWIEKSVTLLVNEVKDYGFLSESIQRLGIAFKFLPKSYPPDVMASVICYSFGNSEIVKSLYDNYFKHIKELKEKDEDK